jgi:hypothetical protein
MIDKILDKRLNLASYIAASSYDIPRDMYSWHQDDSMKFLASRDKRRVSHRNSSTDMQMNDRSLTDIYCDHVG